MSSRWFVLGAVFLLACAEGSKATIDKSLEPRDNDSYGNSGRASPQDPSGSIGLPEEVNDNSGAFGPAARPASADAGGSTSPPDAGPAATCGDGLAPGDLAIVEIMIDSRAGSGDDGEWAEIRNMRACTVKIKGVSIESPRGAATPDVATITDDIELAPGATFLVADSSDATKNHGLKSPLVAWNATDVLKNSGDSLLVKLGTVEIDKITYPDLSNLSPGRSFAFPSDCPLADRTDWRRWSLTFTAFATGAAEQQGTPNAPNADVACF